MLTYLIPVVFIAYLPAAAITGSLDITRIPEFLAFYAPLIGVLA